MPTTNATTPVSGDCVAAVLCDHMTAVLCERLETHTIQMAAVGSNYRVQIPISSHNDNGFFTYFESNHDVDLIFKSLFLLSICCVGPKGNKLLANVFFFFTYTFLPMQVLSPTQ